MRRARLSGVLVFTGIALLCRTFRAIGQRLAICPTSHWLRGLNRHFAHLTTTLAELTEHRRRKLKAPWGAHAAPKGLKVQRLFNRLFHRVVVRAPSLPWPSFQTEKPPCRPPGWGRASTYPSR